MPSRARWWAGRWIGPWPADWQSQLWSRQSRNGSLHSGWFITPIAECNMPATNMCRPANPYDNASCESFIKTLKREEIYANEYDDLEHLLANLEQFIEQYYNRQRLHSALGYSSPEEFERQAENQDPAAEFRSATMRFFHA